MGTTFTGALCYDLEMYLGHVGDSRAYQIRGGKVTCLTEDHTIGNRLDKEFEGTDQLVPAKYHNILYRCMGYRPWVKLDFKTVKALSHDAYLFCSDGLYNQPISRIY